MTTTYNGNGPLGVIEEEDELEMLATRRPITTRDWRHAVAGLVLAAVFFMASAAHLALRIGGIHHVRHPYYPDGKEEPVSINPISVENGIQDDSLLSLEANDNKQNIHDENDNIKTIPVVTTNQTISSDSYVDQVITKHPLPSHESSMGDSMPHESFLGPNMDNETMESLSQTDDATYSDFDNTTKTKNYDGER